MIKLDFKKFKKIASDEHQTTMQHEDGHQITIAHKPLSQKVRKDLDSLPIHKMAEGGEVNSPKIDPKKAQEMQAGATQQGTTLSQGVDNIKKAMGYDGGGQIPGGPGSPAIDPKKAKEIEDSSQKTGFDPNSWLKNIKEGVKPAPVPSPTPKKMADGGDVEVPLDLNPSLPANLVSPSAASQLAADSALVQQNAPMPLPQVTTGLPWQGRAMGTEGVRNALAAEQAQNTIPQQVEAAPQMVERAPAATPPSEPQIGAHSKAAAEMPSLAGGYAQEMQGIGAEAAAKGQLGKAQEAAINDAHAEQVQNRQNFESQFKQLESERQNFVKDIQNNHIDPSKYWNDHSKLMTGLGIILAGFNPTDRPNAAIEFLNKQMEQNIQAQAQNLNSKHNLLAANMHQFGNLRDAMQMTRVMQHDLLASQLDALAAKSQDPMAKARALQLKGQLQMSVMPHFMDLAFKRAMAQSAEQQSTNPANATSHIEQQLPYLRVMKPEMAKEIEGRLVPGVGMASIPVPDKAREALQSRQALQEQVQNLREWSKKHGGELKALSPADVNYGQALANAVQDAYRRANGQGVFREAEANFVKGIVAEDPTAFFNKVRVDPKYKALEDSNLMELNSVRKAYGLPQAQAAPQIKIVDGVKYMRGPNGEAIRVK